MPQSEKEYRLIARDEDEDGTFIRLSVIAYAEKNNKPYADYSILMTRTDFRQFCKQGLERTRKPFHPGLRAMKECG